ncbi:MAG: ATP-dependent RNA helicase ddx54 [Paramarteilia canceri]
MLATDIAARGVDIPDLDIIINFNFPNTPKLFMHRVGRVARLENKGLAVNLVSRDELPWFINTLNFLNNTIGTKPSEEEDQLFLSLQESNNKKDAHLNLKASGFIGKLDENHLESINLRLTNYFKNSDIALLYERKSNAQEKFSEFNKGVDPSSLKQTKILLVKGYDPKVHPIFGNNPDLKTTNPNLEDFLNQIKQYKCKTTVFESSTGEKQKKGSNSLSVMNDARRKFKYAIEQKAIEKNKIKLTKIEQFKPKRSINTSRLINIGNQKLNSQNPNDNSNEYSVQKELEIVDKMDESCFRTDVDEMEKMLTSSKKKKKYWDKFKKKFVEQKEDTKKQFKVSNNSISYTQWLKNVNRQKSLNPSSENSISPDQKEIKSAKEILKKREKKNKSSKFPVKKNSKQTKTVKKSKKSIANGNRRRK